MDKYVFSSLLLLVFITYIFLISWLCVSPLPLRSTFHIYKPNTSILPEIQNPAGSKSLPSYGPNPVLIKHD